jgi:hypothetical protein
MTTSNQNKITNSARLINTFSGRCVYDHERSGDFSRFLCFKG